MDDLLKIIFFILIIISFFSSILKKKGENTSKPAPPYSPPNRNKTENDSGYQPNDEREILAEIENLFKQDKPPEVKPELKKTIEKKRTKIEEAEQRHYANEEWHQETKSEHSFEKSWHQLDSAFKSKPKINSRIEEEAKKFEKLLEEKSKVETAVSENFIRKIKSPGSLQEYILMSEIIGKPKSLRR